MSKWKNWSGSVTARPSAILRPASEAELASAVRRSGSVRVTGAGHSFMPLCETDGVLVSLENLEGELELGADRQSAWAPAGWSLAKLTAALWEQGVSLINQGDVNPQALAGAVATGTHGTGAELGSLSTAARAFRLMLADGSIVTCSKAERPDLFEAQRLSLGLLGIATRIEIEVTSAYHLEESVQSHPIEAVAERWEDLAQANRHVEFWLFPYSGQAILKTLNPAPEEGPLKRTSDMDDRAFAVICEICAAWPLLTPSLQRLIVRPGIRQRRVGPAHRIFPSPRNVRFEEMEYELPRANAWPALREAIAWIRKKRLPVTFPFEFRLVSGDDIWLSPFNAGPCAAISMHQYAKMAWREMFAEVERIFRAYGGRPHWAKRHTLNARDVDALYPDAARFRAVRDAHDPDGKFANVHLASLFGVTRALEPA